MRSRLKNLQMRFGNWFPVRRSRSSDRDRTSVGSLSARSANAKMKFAALLREFRANPTRPKFLAAVGGIVLAAVFVGYGLFSAPSAAGGPLQGPARNIDSVTLADAGGKTLVALRRRGDGNGWVVASLHDAPANTEKIARFLAALLGPREKVENADDNTGLSAGEGIVARLRAGDRDVLALTLGLRPAGRYDRVYATVKGEPGVFSIPGDLRGEMGLWKNSADVFPESRVWLKRNVFAFDPEKVVKVEVAYPDHAMMLNMDEEGQWTLANPAPGGSWDPKAFTAWIGDLSRFEIVDAGDVDREFPQGFHTSSYFIGLTMADGGIKTIVANPDASGERMWVESSDYPGRVFLLPEWRVKLYFRRMADFFPKAVPSFSRDDIRVIDIRRDAESLKIIRRRDNGWQAVAQPFPLREDRVALLAGTLAGWRPEDYADVENGEALPRDGGPLVEIILDNGTVHQYRLGGKHPIFPWRYVLLDGATLLSTDTKTARILFPETADILDMGKVFPDFSVAGAYHIEFADAGSGEAFMTLDREADGFWRATTSKGAERLDAAETIRLVAALATWRLAATLEPIPDGQKPLFSIAAYGDGAENRIAVFPPQGKTMPFTTGDGKQASIRRGDFAAWFAAVKELDKRLAPPEPVVEPAQTADQPHEATEKTETIVNEPATESQLEPETTASDDGQAEIRDESGGVSDSEDAGEDSAPDGEEHPVDAHVAEPVAVETVAAAEETTSPENAAGAASREEVDGDETEKSEEDVANDGDDNGHTRE